MLARIDERSKPQIRVTEADYERLSNLARLSDNEGAALLAEELERVRIVGESQLAAEPPFVRLGSGVEYVDLLSGRARRVEVTTPDLADIDAGRLSVLSPVGAALIGLAVGDTFSWTSEDGRPRVVVVQSISAPEPALRLVADEGGA